MEKMKTWIMKDGTEIAIKNMTTGHIVNSIEMLKRMAEEEFDKLLEMSNEDYIKISENYIDLTEELERRIKWALKQWI